MRSYPQPEFSLAKRTISASSSGAMRGRPGEVRDLEPSNFAGNEPPVPGEDGVGLGDTSDLLRPLAPPAPPSLLWNPAALGRGPSSVSSSVRSSFENCYSFSRVDLLISNCTL